MRMTASETDNDIYSTYSPEFAAIAREHEVRIWDELRATPTHQLYVPAAILAFRQAIVPLLDAVSSNTYSDLNPEIVVSHLRARSTTEANVAIDTVSSRVMEAQRFANSRFREVLEVARRSQRLKATSLGTS